MKKILLVEDDKLLGKSVTTAFKEAEYEIWWAQNSDEAFEALKAQRVDLIFLDILLPGKDGYEILKELKASEEYKNIPVVMLSNLGQMKEVDRAMEIGAMDYVIKANIDLEKLLEMTKSKFLPSGE